MKRVLPLLCIMLAFLLLPTPARTASAAEDRYAVAASPDVAFYEKEDDDAPLFLLPYTYYVKVLSRGETYSFVEYLRDSPPYQKVTGYCRTDALTFVDFVPVRPYLFREITVEYVLSSGGSLGGNFSTVTQTFVYYGLSYQEGELYGYVLKDGTFDYIPLDKEPEYELNVDYLPDPIAEPAAASGLSAVHIAVICVACAAAVAIAFFVARGRKKPTEPTDEQSDF